MSRSSPPDEDAHNPQQQRPLASVLARNTVFSYLSRFWSLGVSLLLTPYVYHRLGDELFGVWALIATVTGFTGLISVVRIEAATKYVAEAEAKRDLRAVNQIVSASLAVHAGFAIAIIGAACLAADPALTLLKVSAGARAQARTALVVCVAIACARRLTTVFAGVLEGLQRLDVCRSVLIVATTANAAATLIVLQLGYGIVGLAFTAAGVWLIEGVSLIILARHYRPGLKASLRSLDRNVTRKLIAFALKVQAANISRLSSVHTDRLIIGAVLGPARVAFYELGRRPVMAVQASVLPIVGPLIPTASSLDAREDAARIERLFLRASRYVALLAGAGIGFLVAVGPQALTAWVGEVPLETVSVMQILAVGYLANTLTAPSEGVAYGLGRPELAMWRGFLLVAVQVGLGLLLVRPFGVRGPAAATAVALTSSSVIYVWLVSRHCLRWRIGTGTLRALAGPGLAGLVTAAAVHGLVQLLERSGAFPGRTGAVGLLGIAMVAFMVMWLAVILRTGIVTRDDWHLIRTAIRLPAGATSNDRTVSTE